MDTKPRPGAERAGEQMPPSRVAQPPQADAATGAATGGAAPDAASLEEALRGMPEGPNVEASPWEVQAARGETPLEGPRAGDAAADADPPAQDAQLPRPPCSPSTT